VVHVKRVNITTRLTCACFPLHFSQGSNKNLERAKKVAASLSFFLTLCFPDCIGDTAEMAKSIVMIASQCAEKIEISFHSKLKLTKGMRTFSIQSCTAFSQWRRHPP
jgi:hypothetical protein